MLTELGRTVHRWATQTDPWTNVYGLARSLLAAATLLTFCFTPVRTLFHPVLGTATLPPFHSDRLFEFGFFYLFGVTHLELARWVAVALLLVVASGWRPRITGLLHLWISWSLVVNGSLIDGGDQLASNLALLLLPVTLLDGRRWHWQSPRNLPCTGMEAHRRLIARWFLLLVRVQVAAIYFHSAIAKFAVEQWADGTATYYWLTHPMFGTWMLGLVRPLLAQGAMVVAITWGALAVEYLLSAGLFISKRNWGVLLAMGLALHTGILVFHGLVSFSLAMYAALILYLHPIEQPFLWLDGIWAGLLTPYKAMRASRARHLSSAVARRVGSPARDHSANPIVVIYDSECGMCRATRAWLESRAPSGLLEFVPCMSEERHRRFPGISPARCMEALMVIQVGGQVQVGDRALRVILANIPEWSWAASALGLPPFRFLGPVVYRWIAHRRHAWVWGGGGGESDDCTATLCSRKRATSPAHQELPPRTELADAGRTGRTTPRSAVL